MDHTVVSRVRVGSEAGLQSELDGSEMKFDKVSGPKSSSRRCLGARLRPFGVRWFPFVVILSFRSNRLEAEN